MRYLLLLVLSAVVLQGTLRAQPEIANEFVFRSHTFNGTTLPYRLFIPDGYSGAKKYPIMFALHSAGERGSDNRLQLTATRFATCWADSVAQLQHPCFVVAPQCPMTGGWSSSDPTSPIRPELATAIDILDSLTREFSIDTNRIYVTGFSMGGSATWDVIMRFPERFAAAVPMSGGVNPAYAYKCADVPVWDFHGTADQLVPVQYSRVMIDSLRAHGRSAVYTHCHNRDCSGLPDSAIAMAVRSHEDLFYTEISDFGHTYGIWGTTSNYPFLPSWLFDKYRKQPGSIALTDLKSYTTIGGNATIRWSSTAGDSVEIWFSPDAGSTWQPVANAPNTGTFNWNSALVPDCAFGSIKVFLKTGEGFIIGSDRSSYFAVHNTQNAPPFIRLLDDVFTTGFVIEQDSLDVNILAGDPAGSLLTASVHFSSDSGSTFVRIDTFAVATNPAAQVRRIGIGSLANSDQAVLALTVNNSNGTSRVQSFPFYKLSHRFLGTAVTQTKGSSAATVIIHVVSPAALTGHRYEVTFDDTSSAQKEYIVRDVDRGATVVQHATELDGVTEGPLFDGIRLAITDVTVPFVRTDSTRWIRGTSTLHPTILVPSGGSPNFNDYRITLFSTVVDTSKGGFGPNPAPLKFLVWNVTKNRKAAVVYFDANGDSTIGPDVRIDILEPNGMAGFVPGWSLIFVGQGGDVVPVPGDQFVLSTVKPLTSSDVYEFTGTVLAVRPDATPQAFALEQNYPNPFNPTTTIRFALTAPVNVDLIIYDILGRRVSVLVNERLGSGYHQVKFDGTGLASGVYFCRLTAGSFVQTRKLLLLR